jgi:hypothetical protein
MEFEINNKSPIVLTTADVLHTSKFVQRRTFSAIVFHIFQRKLENLKCYSE